MIFETENGIFECPENDTKMRKNLENVYGHQASDVSLLLDHLKKGDVVVDVGAYIGTFSIPLSKKAKEVHSFEPIKNSFDILKRNIERNKRDNIIPYNSALSDREESLMPRHSGGGTSLFPNEEQGEETRGDDEIEVGTLDSYGLSPSLIKLDCEGMELSVLKGAKETIEHSRPILFIEINREQLGRHGASGLKIELFLRNFGYQLYKNTASKGGLSYKKKRILTLFQGGPFFNVLAVPKN
ncbi:MAG: FkbM family methyltransferase [Candidatus Paceibacterota bacterium]